MNKRPSFILRHLSALIFFMIYILIAGLLLSLEAFVPETQAGLFLMMAVCILLGAALDYTVSKNIFLKKSYKIIAQILPVGIFALLGITFLREVTGKSTPETFNYLIYLFITAPFMIASFDKFNRRARMIFSLIGTGLLFSVYLYLTTLTNELNEGNGLLLYVLSGFMILYTASGIRKLPYLSTILGFIDAIVLFYLYKFPLTSAAKIYGWDYDIAINFEIILLLNYIIGVILSFIAAIMKKAAASEAPKHVQKQRNR